MKRRAALTAGLAASWVAASPLQAPASALGSGPAFFEIETEGDADVLAWVTECDSGRLIDVRMRVEAERLVSPSFRFGARVAGGAVAGDTSRGPGDERVCSRQACPKFGSVTGMTELARLEPPSDRAAVTRAELYVVAGLFEGRLGLGDSAASAERPVARQAFRLALADGGSASGFGFSDTSLSLSAPVAVAAVSTRRLAGFRAALSYAPDSDPCGLDVCSSGPALGATDVLDIWSAALSFDRRSRSTRVRWAAFAGFEHGSASDERGAGPGLGVADPWIASLRLVREEGPVSVTASWLASNDGLAAGRYESASVTAALEQNDWMFSVSGGMARSTAFGVDQMVGVIGASRLVGRNAILGVGVRFGESGDQGIDGPAVLAEAGLRF